MFTSYHCSEVTKLGPNLAGICCKGEQTSDFNNRGEAKAMFLDLSAQKSTNKCIGIAMRAGPKDTKIYFSNNIDGCLHLYFQNISFILLPDSLVLRLDLIIFININ